jgi:hypothetical protein
MGPDPRAQCLCGLSANQGAAENHLQGGSALPRDGNCRADPAAGLPVDHLVPAGTYEQLTLSRDVPILSSQGASLTCENEKKEAK